MGEDVRRRLSMAYLPCCTRRDASKCSSARRAYRRRGGSHVRKTLCLAGISPLPRHQCDRRTNVMSDIGHGGYTHLCDFHHDDLPLIQLALRFIAVETDETHVVDVEEQDAPQGTRWSWENKRVP